MTAVSESFFATLNKELVHLNAWPNLARVRTAVFDYIESEVEDEISGWSE